MSKLITIVVASSIGAIIGFTFVNQERIETTTDQNKTLLIKITDRETQKTSPATLEDFKWPGPKKNHDTEFILNGTNKTSTIKSLTTVAGKPISELETQMRPSASGPSGSTAGFLGRNESLLEVLANDNKVVVEENGLTHQQLAAPLLILTQLRKDNKSGMLKFGKNVFYIANFKSSNGFQHSPFGDELKSSEEFTIFNPETKQKLHYSTLVPEMIYRYGFYEGQGTKFRVPPEKIIEFFGKELIKGIALP